MCGMDRLREHTVLTTRGITGAGTSQLLWGVCMKGVRHVRTHRSAEGSCLKDVRMQWGRHACNAGLVAATDDLSVAEQEQLLAEATPKLPVEWRRRIAAQTGAEAQQPSSFGQIVRCSRFHGPHIIIIGDAAHCVTSTLGQVGYICISGFKNRVVT